jgi:hypothetical protein
MATLGSYTTTSAVRGCLGIDENDCPDDYMTVGSLTTSPFTRQG